MRRCHNALELTKDFRECKSVSFILLSFMVYLKFHFMFHSFPSNKGVNIH